MTRMTVRMLVLRQNLIRAKNSMDLCRDNGEKAIYVRPVERGAYTLCWRERARAHVEHIYVEHIYKGEGKESDRIRQPTRNDDATRRVAHKKVRDPRLHKGPFFPAFPFRVPNEFGRRGSSGRNRKEAASGAAR